jgi:hypothetical protein
LPPLPAALTHSTLAPVDNTVALTIVDNNTHLVASIPDNVVQSSSTLVDINATTADLSAALDINASAASLLTLARVVRGKKVPSFICQSLCI